MGELLGGYLRAMRRACLDGWKQLHAREPCCQSVLTLWHPSSAPFLVSYCRSERPTPARLGCRPQPSKLPLRHPSHTPPPAWPLPRAGKLQGTQLLPDPTFFGPGAMKILTRSLATVPVVMTALVRGWSGTTAWTIWEWTFWLHACDALCHAVLCHAAAVEFCWGGVPRLGGHGMQQAEVEAAPSPPSC